MFAGIYGAVFMFVATVGGGIAARLLKICMSDVWIAVISGVLSFMGSIYTAFVSTTLMMFLGNAFTSNTSSSSLAKCIINSEREKFWFWPSSVILAFRNYFDLPHRSYI